MASGAEFSKIDGLLEVRHGMKEGNVYAAFLFSDEVKAADAAERVLKQKETEHLQGKSIASRPLSPVQERYIDSNQDPLWTKRGECLSESIVVFSAFQGNDPNMREISTSEELAKRVAKIMPQGNSPSEVSVQKDLRGICLKK